MKIQKYKKTIIICFVIAFVILILLLFLLLIDNCLGPYYRPNKDKIEKYFNQDKENIVILKDYFIDDPIASSISSLDFKSKNYSKLIKNENVVQAFYSLFEKGYSEIGKQGNTIYFLKWTRGSNLGVGIAYSVNNIQPELKTITKLEALSENGWYFYESDYNV